MLHQKIDLFFGAVPQQKDSEGGSQRGDVPPSVAGVRRGRSAPRRRKKNRGQREMADGAKC